MPTTLTDIRWRYTPHGLASRVGEFRLNVRRVPGDAMPYQWTVKVFTRTVERGYSESETRAKAAAYAEAMRLGRG